MVTAHDRLLNRYLPTSPSTQEGKAISHPDDHLEGCVSIGHNPKSSLAKSVEERRSLASQPSYLSPSQQRLQPPNDGQSHPNSVQCDFVQQETTQPLSAVTDVAQNRRLHEVQASYHSRARSATSDAQNLLPQYDLLYSLHQHMVANSAPGNNIQCAVRCSPAW